ncbi:VWA domain-containing protein [Amycolatopsis sp. 195334CR]|uniref:vWA domain-containing protein n=1 Tax=Amycolatopsis sp. 195334CR TaxID=2814588 RepID=UPI001A8E95F4|nr:VWA domain-containing protein [Amycolatopsis sp. 195334CR]MBN6033552.1 VWA domain-containing protein [Amycolatopsis sp. 195334CR]
MDTPLPGFAGFAAALRAAGLPAAPQRLRAFLDAVAQVDLAEREQLYWAGRLTLCADPDDLPRYDRAFASWFGEEPPPSPRKGTPVPRRSKLALVAESPPDGHSESENDPLRVSASAEEVLRHRDFSELSAAEREHLRELFATLSPVFPTRTSARRRPARRGELDPGRTLRAMMAGGEPIHLARRRRAEQPRRVVLLIDVSGSMSPYADALLRFAHVLVRRAPRSVEVFTMGTRLTRVSRQLRQRDPERAMLAAGHAVPDFAGGTRLGEALRVFLTRWGRRGMARRAVVVVFSDGWERGDTTLLSAQLAALRRLAHLVLWTNPHAGRAGYAPVQAGIVAALPHLDGLLAGHSLDTLDRLLREMREERYA